MTPTGPPRPTRRRRRLVLFLVVLVFVIAVFIGLQAWKDSVYDPWANTHASPGTYDLIEAIEVAAILFLFWATLRAGRETGWLFPVLFTAGAALYLYRVVVLCGLFPANVTYTTARTYFPDCIWLPLHLLFWFFGMGVWGLIDRTRAREMAARFARLGVPIAGLTLFLLLHLAVRSYTSWSGRVGRGFDVLWPSALGLGTVLRPVLLVGAFYFLNALPDVPRRRAFEWVLAGVLGGLALSFLTRVPDSSLHAWAADAATKVAAIGLVACLLPRSSAHASHSKQHRAHTSSERFRGRPGP